MRLDHSADVVYPVFAGYPQRETLAKSGKIVLEQMSQLLEHGSRRNGKAEAAQVNRAEERIAALEAKLAKKDGVIAEISAEYVRLKKELGEM